MTNAAPKHALVTGAARRLGRELALYLAGRGYDVAVHYSGSSKDAEKTVADIAALGRKAVAVQTDLLIEAETETLVRRAAEALGGPLTVLVNNASIFDYDTVATATRDSWDRNIGTNLRAPFVLIQQFAEQAPKALIPDGKEPVAQAMVLNMCDQRVRNLTPEFMTYTIAKMGLWALTRTAAMALAPDIRVNAIGPGPTLIGARQRQEHFDAQRAATVLKRGSDPSDIVAALGYFLDARAVTGQLLCVDGGQHLMWHPEDARLA